MAGLVVLPSGPWGQVYRKAPPGVHPQFWTMTESTVTAQAHTFNKEAATVGIRGYHTHRSERSEPGFPDWCFAGVGDLTYYVELKGWVPSKKQFHVPTADQIDWLNRLAMNPNNRVRLCYPWQWPDVSREMWSYAWKWKQTNGIR